MQAGFAEIDITPPAGTHKIGWLKDIISDHVLDPLFARAAVFESGGVRIAVVQLDVLSVSHSLVTRFRERIETEHGFPGASVMVCATHSHAGPAVVNCGLVERDDAYVGTLIGKVGEVFGAALANLQPAELGFGRSDAAGVSFNRRVMMRNGTVRTHGCLSDPEAVGIEGPVDPEVSVLAARSPSGELLGALVNFACHPTHHGPDGALSAGWPGVLVNEMRSRGCPMTLFLQGAAGNMHTANPAADGADDPMEKVGADVAATAAAALGQAEFTDDVQLDSRSKIIDLPLREPTDAEVKRTVFGAQPFVDPAIYDRAAPELIERYRRSPVLPTKVQVLCLNDIALAAAPAEWFVEFALRIKEAVRPRRAVVVGYANGMVGYVPTREAFARGGYETTFGPVSWLAPEAGDLIADAIIELARA